MHHMYSLQSVLFSVLVVSACVSDDGLFVIDESLEELVPKCSHSTQPLLPDPFENHLGSETQTQNCVLSVVHLEES